jgi:glutathione synthase/RimK-type ligase-like ATP-grasp enzyme
MDAGVPVPRIYWSKDEWRDDGNPQLILKPEIGEAGVGIKLVSRPVWDYGYILQKYIDKVREFRVTMVDDIFAYAMEKLKPSNNDVRWNSCRGSEWVSVSGLSSLLPKFKRLGTAGLRAIGYDIGATDMMLDGDNNLYIIEINSKPGLGPQNAAKLAAAISEYLGR